MDVVAIADSKFLRDKLLLTSDLDVAHKRVCQTVVMTHQEAAENNELTKRQHMWNSKERRSPKINNPAESQ
nr:40S ribosomal protein S11-like [Tanacetum cinerariifolium]